MGRFLLTVSILCLSVSSVYTQMTPRPTQQDRNQSDLERRMSNMSLQELARRRAASEERRRELLAFPTQPKMTDEFRQSMEPDADDLRANGSVLNTPGTGIVKLLSSEDCKVLGDEGKLKKCLQRNANVRSFANAFSFRERKRAEVRKADLILKDGYFITGRHSVQTIMISLDDVTLEGVSLDSPGVGYLVSYKPEGNLKKMDADYELFKTGVTVASFATGKEVRYSYGKIAKVEEGKTYVVRSIAYRPEGNAPLDKDQDVIFAFRVVDRDKNKNATIVWKELKRGPGLEMKN